jgi:transcription elongation factor Elf1
MSFICGICHKSTGSLYSKLIVEIREKKKSVNDDNIATFSPSPSPSPSTNDIEPLVEKIKMAHIECCSHEQIKQILLSQAEDQIIFYKDIIDLIKEGKGKDNKSFLNKLNNFEQKYGYFDEIRQGTSIDRDIFTFALIAELKRKSQIE